jgi:GDP-mannose 6-dehydrogenase
VKDFTDAVENRECVAVLGLGYVGCVTAACLAHLGHRVIGVDRDRHKLDSIAEKRAPFYEPGLEEIIRETVTSGRLSVSDSVAAALEEADIVLVCVGTPSGRNGDLNLEQLARVCAEVRGCLPGRTRPLVLAIRSTVFPGTCEEVVGQALGPVAGVSVVANPEFLREGVAVKDFLEPSLLVVGSDNPAAAERVARVYAGLPVTPCQVSLRTAEMIKYACNAFHAVKIAFANEIGTLCGSLAVSGEEVMHTVCRDERLTSRRRT